MFYFLTDASTQQAPGLFGGTSMIIMLVAMFAIMYFMVIRPENKKKKEQEALRNSIKVGDQITTIGGIMGKVVHQKDDVIVIESGEDQVRLELQKWSVMTNNTAEKEKSKRAAEARDAAQKAKDEKAKEKARKKADKDGL